MEINPTENQSITERLHGSLQELIGLHRQLYEVVKAENEAITNADVKLTYEASANKEALIHWIHQSEMSRQAVVHALVAEEGLDVQSPPSLRELILHYQSKNPDVSQKLQTNLTSLLVLVDRIKKQNELNGKLVNESLKHIHNMKKNIFGETNQSRTYNQMGQKTQANANENGPRLISKEV